MQCVLRVGISKLYAELIVVNTSVVNYDAIRAGISREIQKVILIKRHQCGGVGRKSLVCGALNCGVRKAQKTRAARPCQALYVVDQPVIKQTLNAV